MNILRTAKHMLLGLVLAVALSIVPNGFMNPLAHAEMNQGMASGSQNCCQTPTSGLPLAAINHGSEEKQDEDPAPERTPYYLQFTRQYIPRKISSLGTYSAATFRPPDLVKLYANFRF